ncbi:MAG: FHA domain-containing protein [Anaerolineae bacterium]|nr:FHA domain-containing protein [Anaerolineae bacterium]
MKNIIEIAMGVVLGQALWGCAPFILLALLFGGCLVFAVSAEYWWVILLVIAVIALLNLGTGGAQRRHTMGHYATRLTGYRPRPYRLPTAWSLKITNPDGSIYRLPVHQSGCWVGRSHDCQLCLHDAMVSRHHCWIGPKQGYLQVYDNRSRYGVLVNGRRVSQAYLHPGDDLRLGQTRVQVR